MEQYIRIKLVQLQYRVSQYEIGPLVIAAFATRILLLQMQNKNTCSNVAFAVYGAKDSINHCRFPLIFGHRIWCNTIFSCADLYIGISKKNKIY